MPVLMSARMTMRRYRGAVAGAILLLVAACGGSSTPPSSPGGTTPAGAGATATPAGGGGAGPTIGPGAGGGLASLQPIPGGGPTGKPAAQIADIAGLLGPGDFNAVGVPGAGTPSANTNSGPGTAYVVYAGKSSADGGIEFDVFAYGTAAETSSDFGPPGLSPLDPAEFKALGADKASMELDEPGNDPQIRLAEIRVLKGRIWFDLGIPNNPLAEAQLVALSQLVLQRAAAII